MSTTNTVSVTLKYSATTTVAELVIGQWYNCHLSLDGYGIIVIDDLKAQESTQLIGSYLAGELTIALVDKTIHFTTPKVDKATDLDRVYLYVRSTNNAVGKPLYTVDAYQP